MNKSVYIIVDPNNDFVDKSGSLYIKGAEQAVKNTCKFLDSIENPEELDIILVQDTHPEIHSGMAKFWKPMPDIGTLIDLSNYKTKYETVNPSNKEDIESYLIKLDTLDRGISIWPDHCIKDTWGWEIPSELSESLARFPNLTNLFKGEGDEIRDMYSFLSTADKSYSADSITLTSKLSKYEHLYISGFAEDICLLHSLEDIISAFLYMKDRGNSLPKINVLVDCSAALIKNSKKVSDIYDVIESEFKGEIRKHQI